MKPTRIVLKLPLGNNDGTIIVSTRDDKVFLAINQILGLHVGVVTPLTTSEICTLRSALADADEMVENYEREQPQ